MKNPRFTGGFSFCARVCKPNSVPILPTEGGAKSRTLSSIEEWPLDFARDAQFCNRLRRTKLATAIYLGLASRRSSSGTRRILPTEGGCKFERPEFYEGLPLASLGTLNFAATCGRQNWRTALHSGKDLAVSPLDKLGVNPKLNKDSSLFAPLSSAENERQGLPGTFLTDCSVSVRTFLYRFCPPKVVQNREP